jgi:hypothetical protein
MESLLLLVFKITFYFVWKIFLTAKYNVPQQETSVKNYVKFKFIYFFNLYIEIWH